MKKKGERKDQKPPVPARGPGGRFIAKSPVKTPDSKPAKAKAPSKSPVKLQDSDAELRAAGRINSGIVSRKGQQPPANNSGNGPENIPQNGQKIFPTAETMVSHGEKTMANHGSNDSGGHFPDRPIGPGNPPRAGQIQPGEVRNPKGYPEGQLHTKTLIKYWLGLEEEIKNPLDPSQTIRVSILDSAILAIVNQARKGNVVAFRELMDRIEGKPVQSTKLLNADDKMLEISIGFAAPQKPQTPKAND